MLSRRQSASTLTENIAVMQKLKNHALNTGLSHYRREIMTEKYRKYYVSGKNNEEFEVCKEVFDIMENCMLDVITLQAQINKIKDNKINKEGWIDDWF